ncbi:hypothetical protein BH18CHL1_BH18CHL1_03910 [soil metagenome]
MPSSDDCWQLRVFPWPCHESWRLSRIDLKRVLDLRLTSVRDALDISVEDITGDDLAVPRAIGEAAQRLGYEAIVAPSATGIGHVVAIMLTNLAPDSSIEVLETRPYDPGMPTT